LFRQALATARKLGPKAKDAIPPAQAVLDRMKQIQPRKPDFAALLVEFKNELQATLNGLREPQQGTDLPADSDAPAGAIIPRGERWLIRWTSANLQAYIRQLDFFKIELGTAGGKKNMDYVFNLTKENPDTREADGSAEKRMFMTWKGGEHMKFDKTILARAGIPTDNRLLFQFYPQAMEERLAFLELQNATRLGHTDVREIRQTIFGVRARDEGYELFVAEQKFGPR